MVKMETSVVINRQIDEVFEFSVESENDALWQSGVLKAEQTSEGPMRKGATFVQVVQFLGRRLEFAFDVTEYEPNRKFGFKTTSGPIPIEGAYTYETVADGSKITMFLEGEPGGFFKLAEPIVARTVQRQWETNFANLKDVLETQGQGAT
jgi:hypothetical protein